MEPYWECAEAKLYHGDCRIVMAEMEDNSVDSVVCDPPYEIGFMQRGWDSTGIAYEVRMWQEVMRVLKPGGHLLAFGGTRTYHRLACAIEDAGFDIRDQIGWTFGSGFPKSLDVAKSIDKAVRGVPQGGSDPTSANHGKFKGGCSEENEAGRGFGAGPGKFMREAGSKLERELVAEAKVWQGWGTALKPAWEPVCVARKPFKGTVVANVLKHGTGALNIDACRIEGEPVPINKLESWSGFGQEKCPEYEQEINSLGRWPANLIHDGSEEVLVVFPKNKSGVAIQRNGGGQKIGGSGIYAGSKGLTREDVGYRDSGSAARFFYCAKANAKDRHEGLEGPGIQFEHGATLRKIENTNTKGNNHPTVKPTDLMRYLCRLVTPPGGTVLDPFNGSGSTGKAALLEGFKYIGIEGEEEYCAISKARLQFVLKNDSPLFRAEEEKEATCQG